MKAADTCGHASACSGFTRNFAVMKIIDFLLGRSGRDPRSVPQRRCRSVTGVDRRATRATPAGVTLLPGDPLDEDVVDVGRQAHVLLQVDPGRSWEAQSYLAALPTVTQATVTSGAYDVIATVEAASDEALSRALVQARATPGLCVLRLCRPAQV